MNIDKKRVKTFLLFFQKTKEGYKYQSELVKLGAYLHLNRARGEKIPPIYNFLQFIDQDIDNLVTITNRLAWENKLFNEGKLGLGEWMEYAKCDIDLFHVKFRSIFDYLSKIFKRISDRPKEVKAESFAKLKNWLTKSEENEKRLGKDLAKIVSSVDWFDNIKNARDTNIHQGGMTMVFLEKERILFQILKGSQYQIFEPELMYNENIVDFELYAGMYYGYLMAFLEDAAKVIHNRIPDLIIGFGANNPHRLYEKLPIIYQWIEKLDK